jgi:hypothetical protein
MSQKAEDVTNEGVLEEKNSRESLNENKLRELQPQDLLAQRAMFFRIYTSLPERKRLDLY